jgi:hypothetical protein
MGKKIFLALLLTALVLNAHPPKSIDLAYDDAKAELTVKIWHKSGNPESHYIDKVTVLRGDEAVAEKTYQKQQTGEFQEEVFSFAAAPLKKGDLVKVRASCNKFGKKTVTLEWPK